VRGGGNTIDVASQEAIVKAVEVALDLDHVVHSSEGLIEGVEFMQAKKVTRRRLQLTVTSHVELRITAALSKYTAFTNDQLYASFNKILNDKIATGELTILLIKYANEFKALNVIEARITTEPMSEAYDIVNTAPHGGDSSEVGFNDLLSTDSWIIVLLFLSIAFIALVYMFAYFACSSDPDQNQKKKPEETLNFWKSGIY
jgi:hypothetical protein